MKSLRHLFTLGLGFCTAVAAAEFDAASATNRVGLDLYRQLAAASPGTNLVISPYSIESALALVYAGAAGETRTEMAKALHFPADNGPLQKSFATLRTALDEITSQSRVKAANAKKLGGHSDAIEWHAANRLFGQQGFAFRDSFLTLMRDGFVAPFEPRDFRSDAEPARLAINKWVEEQTKQKIRDLIPKDGLTTDTRLVLVNALYLKAPWQTPFPRAATKPAPFFDERAAAREVPTMRTAGRFFHADESDATVVALDYIGGGLQFLVLLPKPGVSVDALAAKLTTERLTSWARADTKEQQAYLQLSLPKFRVEGATVSLDRMLKQMGVRSAFDDPRGSANFDAMAPRKPDSYLAVSSVFHQTFVEVDEKGTEAAAATAIGMVTLGMPVTPTPIEVRIDRPFLFAIQHRASGTCLFLGRITDPR